MALGPFNAGTGVETPVNGVISEEEFEKLPEDEKNHGMWVIPDAGGSGGGGTQDNSSHVSQEQVGVPGGIATLGGDGKLTVSQRPEIDAFTREETTGMIGGAVTGHNTDTAAHGDIRASVAGVEAAVRGLELKYGTDIKENPFTVSFGSLDDLEVTGVWNASQSRVEF